MATPTPERAVRALRILHAGMLVILAGFGIGGWIYIRGLEGPAPAFGKLQVIFYMLAAISAVMIAMIPVIRARMMPVIPPGLKIEGGARVVERASATLLSKWGNAHLICWALAMSIGLYGAVMTAMLQQIWPYPVFAGPAAALLIYYRPRLEAARALLARIQSADTE